MIKTTGMIMESLKDYRYPANKLSRMVKDNTIFPIVRGLYVTDKNVPGRYLAASIYGPSYLSFDYALAYWHLIPEAVFAFTSATYDKKKKKQFDTPFGIFLYRDVPKAAYPFGIQIVVEGDYSFLIAEPEKALCDKLFTLSPITRLSDFENMLFQDLRIDPETFDQLDKDKVLKYASLYRTTNHRQLIKFMGRLK